MAKQREEIKDLKRRLALLDRLDAPAVICADGVFLVAPGKVRDPRPLVSACQAGRPTSTAVHAALGATSPPIRVGAALLAAAHRDLRAVEGSPPLRALAREARLFRRYGEIDDAWIERKRRRLGLALAKERAALSPVETGEEAWFERVLELVGAVHGDEAVGVVRGALGAIEQRARGRRLEARRAVEATLAALSGERDPTSPAIARAVADLRAAARLPGRARLRRVTATLRALLELPEAPEAGDPAAELAEQVRAVGERLLAGLREREGAAAITRARTFLAHYALAFDPRPRGGRALVPTPAQIDLGLDRLARAVDLIAGRDVRVDEAIALLHLDLGAYQVERIAELVASGLPIAKVERLAALDRARDLPGMTDARAAEAYADWAIALVPHYKSLGLDVPIDPTMFGSLRSARREDLAVLAICLMKHHGRAEPGRAEQAIARLDATLGLFRRSPADAAAMLADLAATTPGAGRACFPELAAWLDDDALLDRYVHLARLAAQPVALSRNLQSDFLRGAALDRERAHLSTLPDRTPDQEARLRRLDAGLVERPGPAWTRRRLAERVEDLLAAAYEERLGVVLRRLLMTTWGIAAPRLTPGWRDALRFFLAVDDNRNLLAELLRCAAAGVDPKLVLPKNQAFIAEARGRFEVDAWLAPRQKQVRIAGEAYTLAIERDPIEVLRMGIPFGTCLSLDDGCNAASTVINAADAGKHVVYLRDARGHIVARKLIAVSTGDTLLGYRLYVAAAQDRHAAIAEAFAALCAEIGESARLPLAASGDPRRIHEGFWYDDGALPFGVGAAGAAVDAYCRALGRPVPPKPSADLQGEAEAFAAVERGDEAAARLSLEVGWPLGGPRARAASFLADRLPPEDLLRAADSSTSIARAALDRAAREGVGPLVDLGLGFFGWMSKEVMEILARFPRSEETATALVTAMGARRRTAQDFDDSGLAHQSVYTLHEHAAAMPVRAGLRLCDQIAPVWARVIAGTEGRCQDCVEGGEHRMAAAIGLAYARAPDPEAVIERLGSARSSRCARRAALYIAARYALTADATAPTLPPPRLSPLLPCPEAMRALALLRRREPGLTGDPDLLAALLRQSAGTLPFGVTLPTPRDAPFEALGDLLVQLDLSMVVAPWPAPPTQAPLHAAMEIIERFLGGDPVDHADRDRAYRALLEGRAPDAAVRFLVERLVSRGDLAAAERELIATHVRAHGVAILEEAPDLAVRVARDEALRGALVEALARHRDRGVEPGFWIFRAAAARAGEVALADLLFDAWVRALLGSNAYDTVAEIGDDALFRRAARVAISDLPPAAAIEVYRQTKCHAHAAIFLEELERSPTLSTPQMRRAIEAQHGWDEGGARGEWLRMSLAARRAADAVESA